MHAPNNPAPKRVKQKLTGWKGEIDGSIMIAGTSTPSARTSRFNRHKTSKDIVELDSIITYGSKKKPQEKIKIYFESSENENTI
jgi:hypothetical protein